jgi:hypothetical protein
LLKVESAVRSWVVEVPIEDLQVLGLANRPVDIEFLAVGCGALLLPGVELVESVVNLLVELQASRLHVE